VVHQAARALRALLREQVRDKMETARKDTVGNVDKYTKKYKPYADKYNKLCVSHCSSSQMCTSEAHVSRCTSAGTAIIIASPTSAVCA
jgi:hypothetical protein